MPGVRCGVVKILVKLLRVALVFAEGTEKRLEMQFRPDTQKGAESSYA